MKGINYMSKKKISPKLLKKSLEECRKVLNKGDSASQPLPGRETQIYQVLEFINEALENYKGILYIFGQTGTGKTATVKQCINMCKYPDKVFFVSCVDGEKPPIFGNNTRSIPKIIVLDDFEILSKFDSIKDHYVKKRCSLILISIKLISKYDRLIIFNSYTDQDLKNILIERVGGVPTSIDAKAIELFCKQFAFNSGDSRKAISIFKNILSEAIELGKTAIDATFIKYFLTKDFKNQQNMESIDNRFKILPELEIISLVAIIYRSKAWKKVVGAYFEKMHVKDVIFDPYAIFQNLKDIGLIKGSYDNPKACISDSELSELGLIAAKLANDLKNGMYSFD